MKEILQSGVTGILVSHSLSQIRSLCNKILWLDHGNQIAFTDDVNTCCDAYEGFLMSKQPPENWEQIEEMAVKWSQHQIDIKDRSSLTKTQKIELMLYKKNEKAAIRAAEAFLRQKRPDLFKEEYGE